MKPITILIAPLLVALFSCSPTAAPSSESAVILAAYEPILACGTEPGTRLDGEFKELDDWAFFLGNTVDALGEAITPPDGISSDTVILFRKTNNEWRIVDHGLGISDAFYLGWPDQYGAPKELFAP